MAVISRTLSTNDIFVFNDCTHDLILIDAAEAQTWASSDGSWDSAVNIVNGGHATQFSARVLRNLQSAVSFVALLGG